MFDLHQGANILHKYYLIVKENRGLTNTEVWYTVAHYEK